MIERRAPPHAVLPLPHGQERIEQGGGKQTLANHWKEDFWEIGKRGFAATVNRHYGGDATEYLRVQRKRDAEHGVAVFVDLPMKELLHKGERTVCVELPVILELDDDMLRWASRISLEVTNVRIQQLQEITRLIPT